MSPRGRAHGSVILPLLACDQVLFAALRAVWREPQLLEDLGAQFLCDEPGNKARALFQYLFTECPAVGSDGFRLRDAVERLPLRYANERRLAKVDDDRKARDILRRLLWSWDHGVGGLGDRLKEARDFLNVGPATTDPLKAGSVKGAET